jgi:hypothetical protein
MNNETPYPTPKPVVDHEQNALNRSINDAQQAVHKPQPTPRQQTLNQDKYHATNSPPVSAEQ